MSELRFETYEMPAAALGPENPLPPLISPTPPASPRGIDKSIPQDDRRHMGRGCYGSILPYRRQDDYDRLRRPRAFKVAVLENDILRATFLLELGGRLWSLFHKPANRELLFTNPVFQPGNLALRNAWFSGGVEWNISKPGHCPLTCSPLFAARVKAQDGCDVLRLYEWERLRGVPFQIDARLPDGSPFLFVRVRIINPHDSETMTYWWSNIGVRETPDIRVIAPADSAIHTEYPHGLRYVPTPYHDGADTSYPANARKSADYFFRIPDRRRRWIAVLDAAGKGLVQTSTSLLRGRKMFVWGHGPGGKRWRDFLSVEGQVYFEVQAGLARTQRECLPMAPRSQWQWLEAYGLMEADPATVHGSDWPAAGREVESRLERMLAEDWMEAELARTQATADRPPEQVVHRGAGWGALERRRRQLTGDKPFCGQAMIFDDETLTADQQPWLALLERGELPCSPVERPPGHWMVRGPWRELLEAALQNGRGDHWLSHLHLGVMHYNNGQVAEARRAWERSLACERSAWALRNLAVLERHQKNLDAAAELYVEALRLLPTVPALAADCLQTLIDAGRPEDVAPLIESLDEDVRSRGRIQLLKGAAALDAGDLETVRQVLDGNLVVNDMREGEVSLSDLWYGLHEKRLAAAENVTIDESLRQRVRRDFPPPPELDFRMATVAD